MRTIVEAIESGELCANPKIVISNNAEASALAYGRDHALAAHHVSQTALGPDRELDATLLSLLRENDVQIIVLSGYLRKLGPKVLKGFDGRILNIHPALLPSFGGIGMHGSAVHKAVLAAGETESGATVHLVDAGYDTGKILLQRKVPVFATDTAETLAGRVKSVEGDLFVDALSKMSTGILSW